MRCDSALLLVIPRQETQQQGARVGALDAAFLDGLEQVLERRPVTQAFLGEIATAMEALHQRRPALAVTKDLQVNAAVALDLYRGTGTLVIRRHRRGVAEEGLLVLVNLVATLAGDGKGVLRQWLR